MRAGTASKAPAGPLYLLYMRRDTDEPKVVGRATLCVSDVARALGFYRALDLRPVLHHPHFAVFELRGGTHLLLVHAREVPAGGPVRFGLVVDDADGYRDRVTAAGVEAGPVRQEPRSGHRGFEVTDPDGHVLKVLSSRPAMDRLEHAV